MQDARAPAPDSTAVRVALWRALHVEADPPPHVADGLRPPSNGEELLVATT